MTLDSGVPADTAPVADERYVALGSTDTPIVHISDRWFEPPQTPLEQYLARELEGSETRDYPESVDRALWRESGGSVESHRCIVLYKDDSWTTPTDCPEGLPARDIDWSTGIGIKVRINQGRNLWPTEVDSYEELVEKLRQQGFDAPADRLDYLKTVLEGDPDRVLIQIDSLRNLVRFLVTEPQLSTRRIGVSPDGTLEMEWFMRDGGLLAMWFLNDGKIQFAAIAGEPATGRERRRVSGVLEKREAMQAVRPFIPEITPE